MRPQVSHKCKHSTLRKIKHGFTSTSFVNMAHLSCFSASMFPVLSFQSRDCLDALCRLVTTLREVKTPVITLLNGSCVGSGYALAMGKYRCEELLHRLGRVILNDRTPCRFFYSKFFIPADLRSSACRIPPYRVGSRPILNRFATEHSSFCVPEATLGLGLAGGLSYTLPRLLAGNQPLAQCLALTGLGLEGPDVFFTQLATNYITNRRLDMMVERLAEVRH